MATRKSAASKPDQAAESEPEAKEPDVVDEVVERGGWNVGYVGDRVDDTPNEAYTVSGVLKAADTE